MNCEQVQSLLVSYLHHETTPSERTLIRAHLSGCAICQKELALLSTAQSQIGSVLQHRASYATPAPDAWDRLEARLAKDAQPIPAQSETWFSRLKLGVSRVNSTIFSGDSKMNKRYTLATASVATLAAVTLVAVLMFNSVTSVSAQQIIERATAVQSAAQAATGIEHTRIEIYRNMLALTGANVGTTTTTDDYDYTSKGLYRSTTYDAAGKIVTASSMDGNFSYWLPEAEGASPQIVHRTPIGPDGQQKVLAQSTDDGNSQAASLFNYYRNNPRVELKGKETRPDGTQVYVLIDRNYQTSSSGQDQPVYTGSMSMVFDAQTYRLLESETSVHKNGQDIVIEKVRFLLQETLPVETSVAWNLNDLKDVTFVDDDPAEQTETLPVPISIEELATHPHTYVLKTTVPAGFTLEIVAAPNQPADQPYAYEANYKNAAGDYYFGLQAVGIMDPGFIETSFYDGSYKAKSGLVMNYSGNGVSGMLTTPDGYSFLVGSDIKGMTREQFQALIEDVVPLH